VTGEFVQLVEPHTESDPAALLFQFLTEVGSLVGRGPHVLAEEDQHHANLFTVVVGRTARARKGTSRQVVHRRLRGVDPSWDSDCQATGLSSGEGLIWAVRDAGSPADGDPSPGVSDKRLLVFESEFASPLRMMARQGNTLSPLLRNAWDTGDLRILTKNFPAKATGAHVSVIAHVTEDELHRCLDRTDITNGFANRFLWACARRPQLLPDGGRLRSVNFSQFDARLRKAVAFATDLGSRALDFDQEAHALWRLVYPRISVERVGAYDAATSRAEAQVLRLSLIYGLLDCSETIGTSHLEAALAVWAYADESARYIFGDDIGDPVADRILAALRSAPEGMTREEIRDLFSHNQASEKIDRVLQKLAETGLAYCRKEPTRGRPAERWFATEATR